MNVTNAIPRRLKNSELVFLSIETLVVLVTAIAFLRIVNDDVFITLRYADNLGHGRGFVYTPGERVFGLTTVLLPILQAIFGWAYMGNVLLGNYLLQYVLVIGCVILAGAYFRSTIFMATLIPLLFFNPQTIGYLGNEIILVLFLSLAALCCMEAQKYRTMALCLSLLYLARFDAFIFGAIVTIWWIWRMRPNARQIALHFTIWASLPILWHAFSVAYYGSFLSNSITSKILGSPGIKTFPTMLWERHIPENLLGAYLPVGLLTAAGLIHSWKRTGVYFVWLLAFSLVYSIIHAPGITPWYFHTLTFAIILGYSAAVAMIARQMLARNRPKMLLFAATAGCCLAAGRLDFSWETNRYHLYRGIAEQIRAATSPNAPIEMNEIGILGYYLSPRPVLDHHFLVTPQGKGANRLPPVEILRERMHPEWIVLSPYHELKPGEIDKFHGYETRGIYQPPIHPIPVYVFKRQ